MKVSAVANANIALVKYWGKRNKELMLPNNGSISMTVDGLNAHTTVEFSEEFSEDQLILNGEEIKPGTDDYDEYVGNFMKVVREISGTNTSVKIVSNNNFPTAAGLASSAAGFAALAVAVSEALGLKLDARQLSMLARRGSGSATRSILGGFVEWKRGGKEDGSDSYGEQIVDENFWPEFRMIICVTSKKEKKIKSRAGMAQTVKTSPMYDAWLETVDEDLKAVREGILKKDFTTVGSVTEANCLKMHATMITTKPSIIYWNAGTMDIIHSVLEWRDSGLECYFTIDAGPQVKIICLEKNVNDIVERLKKFSHLEDVIVTKPGEGVKIVDEHLF